MRIERLAHIMRRCVQSNVREPVEPRAANLLTIRCLASVGSRIVERFT